MPDSVLAWGSKAYCHYNFKPGFTEPISPVRVGMGETVTTVIISKCIYNKVYNSTVYRHSSKDGHLFVENFFSKTY